MSRVVKVRSDGDNGEAVFRCISCCHGDAAVVPRMHIIGFDTVDICGVGKRHALSEGVRLQKEDVLVFVLMIKFLCGKGKLVQSRTQKRFVDAQYKIIVIVFIKSVLCAQKHGDTELFPDFLGFMKVCKICTDGIICAKIGAVAVEVVRQHHGIVMLIFEPCQQLARRKFTAA